MIVDENDGIKIAENSEEVFWMGVKKKCEDMKKQAEHEIIIQDAICSLADEKLKPFSKA